MSYDDPRILDDDYRRSFLDALDEAAGDVDVTSWEAEFLDSTLGRERFTEKQREAIDQMIERYGDRIQW